MGRIVEFFTRIGLLGQVNTGPPSNEDEHRKAQREIQRAADLRKRAENLGLGVDSMGRNEERKRVRKDDS